jgi:hypothetical protein
MKEINSAPKVEGAKENQKAEHREGTNRTEGTWNAERGVRIKPAIPDWWLEVPDAEKAVIRDVLTSIRGLKGSRSPQVGQAARKWERSIACFIKFRLMGGASSLRRRFTSSRSASRNQQGASPARD